MINSNCDVRQCFQDTCHNTRYMNITDFKDLSQFSDEDKDVLPLRLGKEIGKMFLQTEQVYFILKEAYALISTKLVRYF